jgi:hypothetical protein
MSNATVVRVGQINGAGDVDALFLKVFAGEVLTAFTTMNKMLDKHVVRQIKSGKSAQFPATWKVNASYHTPGAEIVGQTVNHNERVIVIDDLLIADVFLAIIDEAKNHYDVRGEYSKQTGIALASQLDKNLFQTGYLAARASATITGGNGGTAVVDADSKTNAASLAASLFTVAQNFDEKDVPEDERYGFMKPAQYYLMAQNTTALNKDWNGLGSYSDGKVIRIAGIELVKANNLPTTNIVTGPSKYQGDFTNSTMLVTHRSAIGTVKLLNMVTEAAYDIRRQGTLIVAKYALGSGILRPESAAEIKTA